MSTEIENLTEALSTITEAAEAWFKSVRQSEAAGLLPSVQILDDARQVVKHLETTVKAVAETASRYGIILPLIPQSHSLQWLREAIDLLRDRDRTESELRRRLGELRDLANCAQHICFEKTVKSRLSHEAPWEPLAVVRAAATQLLVQLESAPEHPSTEFIADVGCTARPLEALVKLVGDPLVSPAEGASLTAEVSSAFSPELAFAAARNQLALREKEEDSPQPPKHPGFPSPSPVAQEHRDVSVVSQQSPPLAPGIRSTGISVLREPSASEKQIEAVVSKIIGAREPAVVPSEKMPDSDLDSSQTRVSLQVGTQTYEAEGYDGSRPSDLTTPAEPSLSPELTPLKTCETELTQSAPQEPSSSVEDAEPESSDLNVADKTISAIEKETVTLEEPTTHSKIPRGVRLAPRVNGPVVVNGQPVLDLRENDHPFGSRELARRALSSESAIRVELAGRCAWQLVIEGYPGLALTLLQALQAENSLSNSMVPAWALRMAILGPVVSEPAGEIANLLASDFSRVTPDLFDETPQENWDALRLLGTTAALKASVVAPDTGAQGVLEALYQVGHLVQLFNLKQVVAEIVAKIHSPVDQNALRAVLDRASWNLEFERLREDLGGWQTRVLKGKVLFQQATVVWQKLVQNGVVGELLDLVGGVIDKAPTKSELSCCALATTLASESLSGTHSRAPQNVEWSK